MVQQGDFAAENMAASRQKSSRKADKNQDFSGEEEFFREMRHLATCCPSAPRMIKSARPKRFE